MTGPLESPLASGRICSGGTLGGVPGNRRADMPARAALFVALVLSAPLFAQCSNLAGVAFTPYGAGCSGLFQTPVLTGSYSATACLVSFTLTHSPSCCNTYLF